MKLQQAFIAIALLIVAFGTRADDQIDSYGVHTADRYDSYDYGHCVQTFYDRNHNNWLSIRNVCNFPITVTYIGGPMGSGAMDLGPGQTRSTAIAASEAANFETAPCGLHYIPVDENTLQYWRGGRFRCKATR